MGWRGGCLAAGLVRGSVRHYCLGGCSALFVCARRSWQVWGVGAGTGFCVFPAPPLPPMVPRAARGGSSCPGVSYPRPLVRHSMRSVRSAGLVWLPFWYSLRALCVCVRSRSRGVPALPPSPGRCGARTSHDSGAGSFYAVCAPLCFLPRSRAPSGLLWGGGGLVPSPPCLAWGCVPPGGRACASGAVWRGGGGGGLCAAPPPGGAAGGPRGAGGRSTSVPPSAFPGRAPKRVSLA